MVAMSHGSVDQRERERKKEQQVMSTVLLENLDDNVHDLYHVYGGDSLSNDR
jgi:hypothetical protein